MLLLEQFHNLTLNPANAARLKELVLQLAVQGKLTEAWRKDNPDVEPAAELLKKIELEKEQLVKEKKIKKEQPFSPIADEEIPYGLPEGWVWCRLGNSTNFIDYRGKTPQKINNGIKLITAKNVKKGYFSSTPEEFISEKSYHSHMTRGIPNKGDVLFTTEAPMGNACLLEANPPFALAQRIITIQPIKINSKFLLHIILSKPFQEQLIEKSSGMTATGIKSSRLVKLIIPLPPLAEQKAIVARVEELFKNIEALQEKTTARIKLKKQLGTAALQNLTTATPEDLPQNWHFLKENFRSIFEEAANVKKLRETILQLAVQGKLTQAWRHQNPNPEPASELLKRIQAEKEQLVKEKKTKWEFPLHGKSKEIPPYDIPENWQWVRLWEVAWCFRGQNPPKSEFSETPKDGYVRFIQITDFKTNDRAVYVPLAKNLKFVSKGEIIMAAYRHIGKLSRKMEGAFNVALCKVNNIEPFNRDFLELLIKSNLITAELLAASERGHIPSMHSDHLLSLWVIVPPSAEQYQIIKQYDKFMQLCDGLEKQIEQSKQETEALMQAVVQEALQVNEEVEL